MALEQNDTERLRRLVLDAENTRQSLSVSGHYLQQSLDFAGRIQGSMRKNVGIWSGSALVAGWALSRLPARTKKVLVHHSNGVEKTAKKSLLLASAGLAFQLFRPTLQKFLTQQITVWAEKYQRPEK